MRRFWRLVGRMVVLGVAMFALSVAVVVAADRIWSRDAVPDRAEAIICLGGGPTSGRLDTGSRTRTARCIDLFQAGVAPEIFMTGATSAPLMAQAARAQAVPPEAIFVEDRSHSTVQNALFTGRMLSPQDAVIVVTDAFHLPRSWLTFRAMGFQDVQLAASGYRGVAVPEALREAGKFWFNAGRVALWHATPWLDPDLREALMR